jgi:hypothetical protein
VFEVRPDQQLPPGDDAPAGPVATEPGCSHPQCRRQHPHAGPAILARDDAIIADRAEAAAAAVEPDPEQPPAGGPMSPSELRRMAGEALAGGRMFDVHALATLSLAHDLGALRRELMSPRWQGGR